MCDRNFYWERKKNGQITRMISNMLPILMYSIQLVIPIVCTKFILGIKSKCNATVCMLSY